MASTSCHRNLKKLPRGEPSFCPFLLPTATLGGSLAVKTAKAKAFSGKRNMIENNVF